MTRDRIPLGFPRSGLHGNRCWTRAGPCKPAARIRGKNEKAKVLREIFFKDCTSLNDDKQDVERSLSTAFRNAFATDYVSTDGRGLQNSFGNQ